MLTYIEEIPPNKIDYSNIHYAGFCSILFILMKRTVINIKRNPMLSKGRMGQAIFFAALTNLIYWQRANDIHSIQDQTAIQDVSGSLFTCNMMFFMSGLGPVLLSFPIERAVFLREAGSKMYGIFPYYLAK